MRAHGRDCVSMIELSLPSSTDVHQLERDWAPRLRTGPAEFATQIQTGPQGSATLTRPAVPSQVLELAALETEQPCSIADLQHSVIATRGGSGE